MIKVKDQGEVAMQNLRIGDEVLVTKNRYERVYSFGHKVDNGATFDFIQIETDTAKLELSERHLLFMANGVTKAAYQVRVGEELVTDSGHGGVVLQVKRVTKRGLFAPFTPSGRIIVNGIQCSTFIAFQKDTYTMLVGGFDTGLSFHYVSLLFNFPYTIYFHLFGWMGHEVYTEEGISMWSLLGKTFVEWALRQPNYIQSAALLPALAFAALLYNCLGLLVLLLVPLVMKRLAARYRTRKT
mmetsp:Transcript_11807/g.16880  ORF Transcript_11807/g.16880 Transcript_11807/m.16880 type:complete len:241 (-) Transcript_11807:195-917(-)